MNFVASSCQLKTRLLGATTSVGLRSTYGRFLRRAIQPAELEAALRAYFESQAGIQHERQRCIDGKQIRGTELVAGEGNVYLLGVYVPGTGVMVVDVKKAEYQGAVEAERNTLAKTAQQADDIRQALLIFFRHKPEVLADLGLSPRKERKAMTGREMVAKAAKAKATREGHHAPVVVAPAPPAAQPVAIPPNPITPITPSAAPVVLNGANGSASPQQ